MTMMMIIVDVIMTMMIMVVLLFMTTIMKKKMMMMMMTMTTMTTLTTWFIVDIQLFDGPTTQCIKYMCLVWTVILVKKGTWHSFMPTKLGRFCRTIPLGWQIHISHNMHVLYGYLHVSHLVDFYGRCGGSKPFMDAMGIQHYWFI